VPRQLAILFLALLLSACGSREFQQLQAGRLMAWSELQTLYQLRAALALNLHNGVRPPMATDASTRLLRARQQVQQLPPLPYPDDSAGLQRHVSAQGELGAALLPVLAQARAQPGLQPLLQQFEALDNRIRVQQERYQLATRRYNELLQDFPSSLTARAQGRVPLPPWPALR
jgi:LemA protein